LSEAREVGIKHGLRIAGFGAAPLDPPTLSHELLHPNKLLTLSEFETLNQFRSIFLLLSKKAFYIVFQELLLASRPLVMIPTALLALPLLLGRRGLAPSSLSCLLDLLL